MDIEHHRLVSAWIVSTVAKTPDVARHYSVDVDWKKGSRQVCVMRAQRTGRDGYAYYYYYYMPCDA